jgi:hypothetical protein
MSVSSLGFPLTGIREAERAGPHPCRELWGTGFAPRWRTPGELGIARRDKAGGESR